MRLGAGGGRFWVFGSFLAIALPALSPSAHATAEPKHKPSHLTSHAVQHAQARHVTGHVIHHGSVRVATGHHAVSYARGYSRMRYAGPSCVPYARSATGIEVAGNAWQWWDHAAGTYQRGDVPEPGSVLAFRANGRMRMGHVAVVARVINDREIEVNHANWAGGGISRGMPVVDVSENNDWTAVRVGLGRGDTFGSVYPTYGFIYDRPDTGTLLAAITTPAPQPALNPPPRDLRPISHRTTMQLAHVATPQYDEVAEAPEHPRQESTMPLTGEGLSLSGDRH